MSSPSAISPNDPPPRPPGFQFTIRQMMGMVIFSAVTCAGLLPVFRGAWRDPVEGVLPEILILTGIWWLFVVFFVRRGPLQFWLLRVVLFLPILIGSVAVIAFLAVILLKVSPGRLEFAFALVAIGFVDVLVLSTVYRLVRNLIPAICPACRSLTLISDTGTSRPVLRGLKSTRWCWACQKRFGKVDGGAWELVDSSLPSKPVRQPTRNLLE